MEYKGWEYISFCFDSWLKDGRLSRLAKEPVEGDALQAKVQSFLEAGAGLEVGSSVIFFLSHLW